MLFFSSGSTCPWVSCKGRTIGKGRGRGRTEGWKGKKEGEKEGRKDRDERMDGEDGWMEGRKTEEIEGVGMKERELDVGRDKDEAEGEKG